MMEIPTYTEIAHELCRQDYSEYVEFVHGGRYIHGRFTRWLCRQVQDFVDAETGNAYDILLLSVPPQHGKSMTITETLPSWYLGKHPMHRVIEVSYNDPFATKFLRRNKEKIVEFGKDIFGIEIGYPDNANEFVLDNKVGGMQSKGILSGVTGNPAELFIVDDPIKTREEADSPTMRDKVFEEWLSSWKTRLAPGAKLIVIMTRWHLADLYGKLKETEHNVTVINLPIECEVERDVLGRTKGDPLFPEMGRDKKWLKDFKKSYITTQGTRVWNSLMMGKPTNDDGNIFKREWIKRYHERPPIAYLSISLDATFKDGLNSDYVSITVWGKTGPNHYLLDRIKKIMGFVETIAAMNQIIQRHMDYNVILIEDKANGSAIIDTLRRRYSGIIPIQPEGGKVSRANAVSPLFESGNVYVPDDPSYEDYINELVDFPNAEHDDDVDSTTQNLNYTREVVAEIDVVNEDEWTEDDQINDVLGYR